MSAVINTALTNVQNQSADKVFQNVCLLVEGWHKQSTRMVAGICQYMLVSVYPQDDSQKKKLADVKTFLQNQLNERGLKQAMTYRYIATAQALAQHFIKPGISSPWMLLFFGAKNEDTAFKLILKAIEEHTYIEAGKKPLLDWNRDAEQKVRFSIDVLRVNLGLDNLAAKAEPITGDTRPGNNTGNGSSSTASAKPIEATKASAASIVARIKNDVKAVAELPAETVVGIVDTVVGRYAMAKRLIGLVTMEEAIALQADLNNRIAELAKLDDGIDKAIAGETPKHTRRTKADATSATSETTTEELAETGT